MITLYHGTDSLSAENIINKGIDVSIGENSVDNGKGFYMTPNPKFAMRRAEYAVEMMKRKKALSLEPTVLEIKLHIHENELSVKKFDGCSYEWKEFVLLNRLGIDFLQRNNITSTNHNLDLKYDIVIDETADHDINTLVFEVNNDKSHSLTYMHDRINKIKPKEKSSDPDWDKQVSIHTKKGCSCVFSIEILK